MNNHDPLLVAVREAVAGLTAHVNAMTAQHRGIDTMTVYVLDIARLLLSRACP